MKQSYFVKKMLFAFLLICSYTMVGQTVKGKVVDSSGESLPYVNVVEKETTNGTTTDDNGDFSLNVKNLPATLVVSSVGFKTLEKSIDSAGSVTITLVEDSVSLDEVVLVGSRNKSRTAIDTPVAIDVIDVSELTSAGPQVNLNQILNYVAPSFSSNTQTISDGTDHIDPASLRGLGPDQVLVLVNGKRRHTSSLVNVNGTFGRGSVGTDLNAIPAAAIERIEVLRDGAAAQYGSDAIAGVINIVLNTDTNKLNLAVTSGANISEYSNEQTGGMDGESVNVSASYGVNLGDNGGYITFAGDFDYRNPYSRMKEYEGSIFNRYNAIEWVASNSSGNDLANLSMTDIQFFAQGVTHFDLPTKNAIANASSMSELQNLLSVDVTDAELIARGQTRSDYNMRVGQSQLRGGRFFANMSYPIDDNGTELYSFAGFSSRNGNSAGFYRLPNQSRTYTPLYLNGFLPEINSKIKDKSVAVGIKGKIGDWDVDLSNTWGRNSFDFEISNTSNASMLSSTPTRFDAGGFAFSQNTVNLDFTKNYGNVFKGLNVALGAEYRIEDYEIIAGEEASYTQYDANGNAVTATTSPTTDFFGRSRPGGAQVFPGFRPENALNRDRNNIAAYVDLEADFTERLMVNGAVRFENYSDFGSTFNWKLASRFKVADNFNLRAAASTGFRAPSLHQRYYNAIATQFVLDENPSSPTFNTIIPTEVGTFTNDSQLAQQLGIPSLKQEESLNLSLGFAAKIPDANLTLSLDAYFIAIEDRITYTDRFSIPSGIQTAAQAGSFFANAIDTETQGIDFVATHKAKFGSNTTLKSDLSATFSQTERVDDIHGSQILVNSGQISNYFSEASRIYLEEAAPRTKVNLSNNLSIGKFNVFLRNVYFGEVTEATNNIASQQVYAGKLVTDLSLGYDFTDNLKLTVGANNLFDIYPDKTDPSNVNYSSGRFPWSRRAQQFGIGGRYVFARLSFELK